VEDKSVNPLWDFADGDYGDELKRFGVDDGN
jgi:hypothetical protein